MFEACKLYYKGKIAYVILKAIEFCLAFPFSSNGSLNNYTF